MATESVNETVQLTQDDLKTIRRAMALGMTAYAELERVRNACEVHALCGRAVPDDVMPLGIYDDFALLQVFGEAMYLAE